MTSDLESFYTISSWRCDGNNLVVRLIPDFFNQEIAEPVLTARILDLVRPQEAESSLTRYQSESIVDIKANGSTLELWAEYDGVPLRLYGREVMIFRSEYSKEDYVRVVVQLESQLSSAHSAGTSLRTHLREVENFVVDLINRANTKRSMSSRDTAPSDAQVGALSRVLRRIRDA